MPLSIHTAARSNRCYRYLKPPHTQCRSVRGSAAGPGPKPCEGNEGQLHGLAGNAKGPVHHSLRSILTHRLNYRPGQACHTTVSHLRLFAREAKVLSSSIIKPWSRPLRQPRPCLP